MIGTRTPFYYNVDFPNDFVTNIDYTLIIGGGEINNIVPIKTETFNKPNNGASNNAWIDISPFIRDYYNYTPIVTSGTIANEIRTNNEVLLAQVTAEINDSIGSSIPNQVNKYIASDGYGYYGEGQNFNTAKKILLTHTAYKADARGWFIVPLNCNSGSPNPEVNSVPVLLNFTEGADNYVKYLVIPIDNYTGVITVSFDGETIEIEIINECKFPVNEVQFINKYGVFEAVHFYKAKKENFTTTSEMYKSQFTNGVSYDTKQHQIKKYNVGSNKKVSIETGFLNQDYNDTIEELMQSENVWIDGVPVNVTTQNLPLKTREVDKLISYNIEFEYAFDQISSV